MRSGRDKGGAMGRLTEWNQTAGIRSAKHFAARWSTAAQTHKHQLIWKEQTNNKSLTCPNCNLFLALPRAFDSTFGKNPNRRVFWWAFDFSVCSALVDLPFFKNNIHGSPRRQDETQEEDDASKVFPHLILDCFALHLILMSCFLAACGERPQHSALPPLFSSVYSANFFSSFSLNPSTLRRQHFITGEQTVTAH